MTKTYMVSFGDGTEINVTISDESWRGGVSVMDWEAVVEGLFLWAACRKCDCSVPIAETEHLFLREFSMRDLPILRAFSLPAKENRCLGGDWKGLKDGAFLRRYIKTQYVFFDCSLWALFRHDRGLHEVRFLGLVESSSEEPPELGHTLRPEARGQGYTVEVGLVAPRYAETELGLTAAKIRVMPGNRAGCTIAAETEEQWNRTGGALQCCSFVKRESSVYKD